MKEKVINLVKNKKQYVFLLIALTIFVVILINVLNGNIQTFDEKIYRIVSSLKSNYMTLFLKGITQFGDKEILILISILFLVFIKNKKISISIIINLVSIALLNYLRIGGIHLLCRCIHKFCFHFL